MSRVSLAGSFTWSLQIGILTGALALACFSTIAQTSPTIPASRPNIVIFLSDDHGQKDSTVYGSKDVRTPSMERLAHDGLVFDRAFVASPSCAPSRAALLTGLMPARNGAEPNHAKPRAELKKLPAYLHELGYEVVAIGKVSHYKHTEMYGFDYFAHDTFHDDAAVPEALKWLRARQSTKPLALFVGSNWPHVPWPKNDPEPFDTTKIHLPPTHVDTPDTRTARAHYYAAISRMDTELGQTYDAAREVFGTNLLFLHSSDNGAQWPFGKWNLYDAGILEPMIAVWPGVIKPGTRTDAMVCWVDILPTLVAVAGGSPPTNLDGSSFLPVLRGEKSVHRTRIFASHSGDGNMNVYPIRAIRTDRWKLILNLHREFEFCTHDDLAIDALGERYFDSWDRYAKTRPKPAAKVRRFHERPELELYDLQADPDEVENLAHRPDQAERVKSLRAELEGWLKDQGDQRKVYGTPRLLHPAAEPN
jgi:N-sulfoglucosamine sulfohydrolase